MDDFKTFPSKLLCPDCKRTSTMNCTHQLELMPAWQPTRKRREMKVEQLRKIANRLISNRMTPDEKDESIAMMQSIFKELEDLEAPA